MEVFLAIKMLKSLETVFFSFLRIHNLSVEGKQPKRTGVVWVACVGRTCENDESTSQKVFVFFTPSWIDFDQNYSFAFHETSKHCFHLV